MQRSLKQIIGYSIGALDGEIGKVHDFLFDDQAWIIRYLAADTGKWLPGRRVIISPVDLISADWMHSVLKINRTREEIEKSPPIEADMPVSRQMEEKLSKHFAWPGYWPPVSPAAGLGTPGPLSQADHSTRKEENNKDDHGDPHLRSAREVTGYYVLTTDGEMGHVEDFIVEDELWIIRYLVVDTVNWWPGKQVILSPHWVHDIKWNSRQVEFSMSKAMLEAAPEFDPLKPINREYEITLYDYYGRPYYW